jgi:hypothetical protein
MLNDVKCEARVKLLPDRFMDLESSNDNSSLMERLLALLRWLAATRPPLPMQDTRSAYL